MDALGADLLFWNGKFGDQKHIDNLIRLLTLAREALSLDEDAELTILVNRADGTINFVLYDLVPAREEASLEDVLEGREDQDKTSLRGIMCFPCFKAAGSLETGFKRIE